MGSLTSIERVAQRLDDEKSTRLSKEDVDFDGYMTQRDKDIAKIKGPEDFREMVHQEFMGEAKLAGLLLPWSKMADKFRIRPGEVTIWTGFNGHKKSMVTGYVILSLIAQGAKAAIASFEMKPHKTLKRMCCQAIGTKEPTTKYIDKFLDKMTGSLWLYDQQGEVTVDRIIAVVYYCAEQLGITQFVIDSLMKVVANEDDYNGQKRFIDRLCAAARELNVHIHLVHHSRKRDDEKTRPGKQDSKGSGAIVDQTDNFVVVFCPPKKEGELDKPDVLLYVDKQRHGDYEGVCPLWFDDRSLQFREGSSVPRKLWVD